MEARDIVQEAVIQIIPTKKKCNKAKWFPRRAYTQLRKEEKQKAKEERKDIPSECRVPKKSKER